MSRFVLYLVFLGLAGAVVGISFAILRRLHWSVLSWAMVLPICIAVFAVMIMVGRVAVHARLKR